MKTDFPSPVSKDFIHGANPYMPLWEHVPDGEPRVFTYQGETRVYVYGSHDTEQTEYCGRDYVVWSAPVADLTAWTCHGTCYRAEDNSILYAPDVVQKGDTYYMYAAEQKGSVIRVAKSKTPWGPFTDPVKTDLAFDPGVLVDDDGRVYAWWGFTGCCCAELNEDMATIKEGTLHLHPLTHSQRFWGEPDGHEGPDYFFEASSPRKVMGKYVFVYSKRTEADIPELGVHAPNNGFLSYKWSDSPLEGYRDGGNISFNGGEIIPGQNGWNEMTFRWGNNHGSLAEIGGQWYIFYHRQTGRDEFSRQAMMEPVDVAQGKDGRIFIGRIDYQDGEPVSSRPVEMTSQGPWINGLDARKWISAGYCCHLHGKNTKAYIARVDEQKAEISAPVRDISDGTAVGFRYLQFGTRTPTQVTLKLKVSAPLTVSVRVGTHDGKEVAALRLNSGEGLFTAPVSGAGVGKQAVYFIFSSEAECPVAEFDRFSFD